MFAGLTTIGGVLAGVLALLPVRQGDDGNDPIQEGKCCLKMTQVAPTWPGCHSACNLQPCAVGAQFAEVVGGVCATRAGQCAAKGNSGKLNQYTCISFECARADGTPGIQCKLSDPAATLTTFLYCSGTDC